MVDRLMEMYASWRERSAAVALAYDRWTKATWPERELEFATYRIALDLEERACRRYADLAEELARVRSGRAAALAATH
jgi:hypothetical protein